jgi:excisionase family DNA binding protein
VLDAELTLHEAAEQLGVHYMTAYRYVRLGLLPARKEGGSWQVRSVDLERFRHDRLVGRPADGDGDGDGDGAAPVRRRRRAPWAERLEARLVAGDAPGAWGVVEAALAAGTELDEIYLDVLSPALVSIGTRWERGEIDVAIEHRATGIALRLIGRLGPRCARRGRSKGIIVLGAPVGERHGLPVAILGDLLRLDGWDVSDLGPDTPAASFAHAVEVAGGPSAVAAVGVSVTDAANRDACAATCAAVRAVAPGVRVRVGGLAVNGDDDAATLGADGYASSAEEMVRLLSR